MFYSGHQYDLHHTQTFTVGPKQYYVESRELLL